MLVDVELNVKPRQIRTRAGLLAGALVVVAAGLALAGCGDRFEKGASEESEIVTAINVIDNAGFHEIDEQIREGEVPPTARTVSLHLQTVTLLTDWPSDFDDAAEELARTWGELAAVLDAEDPDVELAGQLSEQAHTQYHDLSHDVWEWLADEAGIDSAAGGDHN